MRGHRIVTGVIASPSFRVAYHWLTRAPGIGPLFRAVARRIVPPGTHVWVHASLGDGLRSWLYLDPRFELTYVSGHYEPHNMRCLRAVLSRGAVFYDVGAHLGVMSLLAAEVVGVDGAVFAFEPDPDNFARLERTVERNGLPQVSLVRAAVWSAKGAVTFQQAPVLSSGNRGAVAIVAGDGEGARIEVSALCLDDFVGCHRSPDVMKIDVEGGEIEVLKGAWRLLTERPPVILCEIHGAQELRAFYGMLGPLGYSVDRLSISRDFPLHVLARPSAVAVKAMSPLGER